MGLLLDFFGESLFFIVCVDVAVLAHSFRVVHPFRVFAFGGTTFTSIPVVAMVTHAFCEVLKGLMRTVGNHTWLPSTLRGNDLSFLRTTRRTGNID